jgi:predicted thioesterase
MEFELILKPGIRGEKDEQVTDRNIACAWGSGGLPVYATPAMIALMERASLSAVDPLLPEGFSTVGSELAVKHLAPTTEGARVRAVGELLEVEGRRLLFKVEAFDETGKIGEGTHGRFIVDKGKFLQKAAGRRGS